MSGKRFISDLKVECEHGNHVVVGVLQHAVPSQLDRIDLQLQSGESESAYTKRLTQKVTDSIVSCDLRIFEKDSKSDTLKQSLKKLDKLQLVDQIKDHEALVYYGVYDSVQTVLARAFVTGHAVGKPLKAT